MPLRPTDGYALWQLLTTSGTTMAATVKVHRAAIGLQATERGDRAPTPDDREAFLHHLADPGISPHDRALSLNNLATVDLLLGSDDLETEALNLSREALELLPDVPEIRHTHGMALLACGQVEDGIPLVTASLPGLEAADRRRGVVALVLAHARAGNAYKARQHLTVARAAGWQDPELEPAIRLLGPLEVEVMRAHQQDTPAATAQTLVAALGARAAVTLGWIVQRHLAENGGDGALASVATALEAAGRSPVPTVAP